MEYNCPLCPYTDDSRESIEAHITGSTNSDHQGRVGRMYRSEIIDQAEPESIRERLTSSNLAKLSEIEDVDEKVEELADEVSDVKRQVNNTDRKIGRLRKDDRHGETDQDSDGESLEELEERLDRVEESIRNIDKMMLVMMNNTNSQQTNRCPDCGRRVNFTESTYRKGSGLEVDHKVLVCPKCDAGVVSGQLK